jgi:two-component system sensor histidine kinase/response regulator
MIVGDDETSFGLIRDLLTGGSERYELDWLRDPPTDYEAVSEVYDGFLVDYHGRFQDGIEVIQSFVDASGYAVPIILLDGAGGDALESLAMQAGASDCLSKSGLTRATLKRSIWHAIERSRILSRLEAVGRDQLRHKDELLSHVSHELRTPVAAIYQFVSLVEDGIAGPLKDGQHQFLGIALKNVESLSRMINDLVDVARARGQGTIVHLRRTTIGRAVDQAMASVAFRAREEGVTLVSGSMPDTTLLADPGRVVQVIINLLDNAIKHTPSGGHIGVTAAMDPEHEGYIKLCVADTGPGIDAKDRDLLFSPLVQLPQAEVTSRQGLGLGLHICPEIV